MSTNKDCILKPVLWFIHELARSLSNSLFTLIDLDEKLADLIIPIADAKVKETSNLPYTQTNLYRFYLII